MITTSMNKIEVNQVIEDDVQRAAGFLRPKMEKFEKALRKMPKAKMHKAYEWHSKVSHQDYVFLKFSKLGMGGDSIMAKVQHGSKTWFYSYCQDLTDTMDIFSVHFFKRYAERTGTPFLMPTIISKFFVDNGNMVKVYQNEENGDAVYATREGLSLCRSDKKRGITKHCTFVSKGMLKPTQLEAFSLVEHKIEEAERKFTGSASVTQRFLDIRLWANSCTEASDMANEIYNQYFDETEE